MKRSLSSLRRVLVRGFVGVVVCAQAVVAGLFLRHDGSAVRSLAEVEVTTWYALPLTGGDTLYCAEAALTDRATGTADTLPLLRSLSTRPDSCRLHTRHAALRVGREGAVLTHIPFPSDTLRGTRLDRLWQRSVARFKADHDFLRRQLRELDYYARTHDVFDEGYHEVMQLRAVMRARQAHWAEVAELLERHRQAPRQAVRCRRFTVDGRPFRPEGTDGTLLRLRPDTLLDRHFRLVPGARLRQILFPPGPRADTTFTDSTGTFYHLLRTDTTFTGTARRRTGEIYYGAFDTQLRRHGFGTAIDPHFVKCGVWREGRFQGEQMLYTARRVYGIDISRHQHEKGRRRFTIDWGALRIKSLGHASKKRIAGVVDYPVRFVFIKSTEGTTVFNRYYAADLAAARRHGIPTAPYHFFSTRTSGARQAAFFIKKSRLPQATLPPMLDVEPSHAQIKAMGGEQALFREMLIWLRAVERASGRRPVLYISQMFVNRYMPAAPAALRDYEVWIARYGEFKPYIRLLFWQLSQDGRVAGIHGDVDINVYNGTQEDWAHFMRR